MNKDTLMKITLVGLFSITAIIYLFELGGDYSDVLSSLIYLIPPLISVVAGIYTVKTYGIKNPHGIAILLITLGIFLWFVGEVTWVIFDLILDIDQFPSIADIFYIAAYPFFIVGLFMEIKMIRFSWKLSTKLIFFTVLAILTILMGYFGVYLSCDPEVPSLENAMAILYNSGDFILLVSSLFIFLIISEYRGGKLFYPWLFIFLGMLAMIVADVLFAIFTAEYEEGIWLYVQMDVLWSLSYILMAYGLFKIGFILRQVGNKISNNAN